MKMILGALLALAGDSASWFGAGGNVIVGVENGQAVSQVQGEVDARYEVGPLYFRADVDLTLDPIALVQTDENRFSAAALLMPVEAAFMQVSPGALKLRLGIKANNYGLESWDPWGNYLPTWSILYNGVAPGRLAGAEVAYGLPDGTELYLFGGLDAWDGKYPLSVAAPPLATVELGISAEKDLFGTWSALVAYPTERWYYGWLGLEVYPASQLTIALDANAGVYDGAAYVGGQLLVNALPEAVVTPVLRAEAVYDPNDGLELAAYGLPHRSLSLGAKLQSHDFFTVSAEAKVSDYASTGLTPGVFVMVAGWVPEPDDYTARFSEEE